jgi:hypothetical protein
VNVCGRGIVNSWMSNLLAPVARDFMGPGLEKQLSKDFGWIITRRVIQLQVFIDSQRAPLQVICCRCNLKFGRNIDTVMLQTWFNLQGKRIENSCIVQPKSVNLRDRKILKCELLQRCAMFFEMSDISFYTSSGGTVEDLPIPRGIANGASSF